jgi:hypothetical protein
VLHTFDIQALVKLALTPCCCHVQVFFLTCAGTKVYPDPRMTSVDAALAFAKSSQLQVGLADVCSQLHQPTSTVVCMMLLHLSADRVDRGLQLPPCWPLPCYAGCSGGGVWNGRSLGRGAVWLSTSASDKLPVHCNVV